MPVMDGFALCREWMRDDGLNDVPFVFFTATYNDPRDEKFALGLGAERYIVKPQDQQVLLGMIGEVLSGRKAGRRVAPIEPPPEESVQLREYNEVLVRKLEDKMVEVEEANRRLEHEVAERKKSERVLKESEEKFRVIFEDARDGIILVDGESRKIHAANRSFCEMLQYTFDEVMQLGVSDYHPEESLPLLFDAFEKTMKYGSWLAENFPVRRKDGSIFYADIKSNPITISGKKLRARELPGRYGAQESSGNACPAGHGGRPGLRGDHHHGSRWNNPVRQPGIRTPLGIFEGGGQREEHHNPAERRTR